MNNTRWWVLGLVIVVVAVGLFAYNKPKEVSGETIKIGVALGLTGYGSGWAEGERQAIQLATDELNQQGGIDGKRIELITEDTKSTQEGTVSVVQKLINIDKVTAILGPTWGDSFQGAYPLTEKAEVPIISPSAAIEAVSNKDQFSYFFSSWWPLRTEEIALVNYLAAHGITKVATFNDIDPFDQKAADVFTEEAQKKGLTVVKRERAPIGTTDFRTTIVALKNSGAQAVYIEMQDTSAIGPFNKQYKELDGKIQVVSTIAIENPENLQKFPNTFDGIIYTYPPIAGTPAYEAFASNFKTKFGMAPVGPSIVNAYNAAQILFAALKTGAQSGKEIRDALNTVKVPGIGVDPLFFDPHGQIGDVHFQIKTIKNNQFEVVE